MSKNSVVKAIKKEELEAIIVAVRDASVLLLFAMELLKKKRLPATTVSVVAGGRKVATKNLSNRPELFLVGTKNERKSR